MAPHVRRDHDREDGFRLLTDTAAAVQRTAIPVRARSSSRPHSTTLAVAAGVGLASLATAITSRPATPASAMASADSQLFALTNQDRTSNGVPALGWSAPLGAIGENGSYGGCGFNVQGRAQDMINRNYFAHPILGCGQYAWSMMSAFGIPHRSAGENIAWNTYGDQGASVNAVNTAWMHSPEHRANILNPGFDHVGIGSANSGRAAWSGGGGSFTNVSVYAQEFARLGGGPVPARAPVPAPAPPARLSAPAPAPVVAAASAASRPATIGGNRWYRAPRTRYHRPSYGHTTRRRHR